MGGGGGEGDGGGEQRAGRSESNRPGTSLVADTTPPSSLNRGSLFSARDVADFSQAPQGLLPKWA